MEATSCKCWVGKCATRWTAKNCCRCWVHEGAAEDNVWETRNDGAEEDDWTTVDDGAVENEGVESSKSITGGRVINPVSAAFVAI